MRNPPILRLAVLALCALASPGAAAPVEPVDSVRGILTRAQAVITRGGERRDQLLELHEIARDLLDTRTMGRRAMGRALLEQPPQTRDEFLELFDDIAVRAWLQRLLLFREPRFEFPGQQVEGDSAAVQTRIVTRRDSYSIEYRMRRNGDGWLATDIVVEGISQTRNYHSQFKRLLSTQSFDELLQRMRRKVDVLREAGT